jgi:quercetin dioxygenase-like cupin family protein
VRYRVSQEEIERRPFGAGVTAALLNGGEHDLATISLMLGEVQPGDGPRLHRHAYEEVIIMHEGRGAFTIDGTTVEPGPGDIIIIPAGLPHRFVNISDGPMRQTAVHAAAAIAIEWLE